jgi:tRNA threonylcarbamoyladenosine modification (KEOPS) complex Cgi121 subunit
MDIRAADPETFLSRLRRENPGLLIQVFGGRRPRAAVVGMIAAQTLTAARSGSILADRPELDLLLRLAGTRQIGQAFLLLGYKSHRRRLFVVAASEANSREIKRLARQLSRDRRFVEIQKKPLTEDDLEAVERAALLAVKL